MLKTDDLLIQELDQNQNTAKVTPIIENHQDADIENHSYHSHGTVRSHMRISQVPEQNRIRLDFVDVCLDVPTKTGTKRILNNVSGYVLPGEILYIMGPSGGGKTSLLDYLCNRTFKSPSDNVYLNKHKWTKEEFKKVARYCKQHPQLYEVFTVQETLNYAASFFTTNPTERERRVNETIQLLGLDDQRDTKVGGLFFRGLSGGQKQRVSVGEQLVADPSLLFLDEPTSGLDSAAAFQLMSQLKNIARQKLITIVASIHQPSQRVFDLSDRLMFLAGGKGFGGNPAFFGRTTFVEKHFEEIGFKNDTNSSMSEWILDEVNGDFGNPENIQKIIDLYQKSTSKQKLDDNQQFGKNNDKKQNIKKFVYYGNYDKQSWIKDLAMLTSRFFFNQVKNPLAVGIRITTYAIMALVIGSCWFGSGNDPKAGEVNNISGVLFFMSAYMAMMSVSLVPIFIEDKHIMIKEKSNGCYTQGSYQIANFMVSIPFTFIISLVSGAICYFLVQFEGEGFIQFVIDLFITLLASEALVLCVAYVFDHLLVCIVLVSMIMGTFMIMSGFFLRKEDIPDYWIWIHYLGFTTYSFQNFMHGAFDDITLRADNSAVPPVLYDYPGKEVLKGLDMGDVDVGVNILIQIAFVIAFRIIAAVISYIKHTGKK